MSFINKKTIALIKNLCYTCENKHNKNTKIINII